MFYEAVLTLEFEHEFCKKKFMIKKKSLNNTTVFHGYNSGSCWASSYLRLKTAHQGLPYSLRVGQKLSPRNSKFTL